MPIYEYVCESCGHELEAIQKMSDEPLRTCPACQMDDLKKKISATAFRLKGGGWYETDFKSGNKKNIAGSEGGSSSSGDSSSTSSSSSDASGSSSASSSNSSSNSSSGSSSPSD
ncbi:MAG: zinc ribbon domain-containing protein [Pseudomonadota bacterium]